MRAFHVVGDRFTELEAAPQQLPADGYLWLAYARREFEASLAEVQDALQRWSGAPLLEPHVSDLLNTQLPSNFDYTSVYDLLVFRRLAAGGTTPGDVERQTMQAAAESAIQAIDTSPVGFVVYDRVLLTVHPTDCQVRDYFAQRLRAQAAAPGGESRVARTPTSPADLMLRMVNHMVDTYLELRRLLSKQLDHLQNELFEPNSRPGNWKLLLRSRNSLNLLEDTCEDQRAAVVEWLDALEEWPAESDAALTREHELLRVRSRDVLEHIERVLTHVRRMQSSAESAVQMHFAQQSNRTNNIMRALTTLTAIFLPLNLVTGFFGMNFDGLPLIHSATGFWVTFGVLLVIGIGTSLFFWRKRYIGRS